ncbi:hypothetical protein LZ017_16475 [Pelomonas sp. CA6]|uniref:hypothetical protein n=1 Tax=Pelomonas sp. CA6 TaxID=2907999 RepID=UPI001F4C1BF4|nr:hypothetical protein [Pelomonas sp. CA6]MCH7344978.1 hypothetical protein [Pelomonas sp. CA6]
MSDLSSPRPGRSLRPLLLAWAALVLLTLLSPLLSHVLKDPRLGALVVASILWAKAWLVLRHFLEVQLARTFIARALWIFVSYAPLAIVLTTFLA